MVHGIFTRQAESAVAKTTVIILLTSITISKKNRITFALTLFPNSSVNIRHTVCTTSDYYYELTVKDLN